MSGEQLELAWDLDALEARVVGALRQAQGRARAIGCGVLAERVGTSPREVQHVIHRLRCEHGVPIASTAAPPAGYFIAESSDEIEAFIREQKSKALGILVVVAAVKRRTLAELLGQLSLESGAAGLG